MRLLVLGFLAAFFPIAAAQPDGAAACLGCHNRAGEAQGAPRIAGQPQPYLVRQLDAYADGRRKNEAMTPIAEKLTPQQRAEFGEYFAGLRRPAGRAGPAEAAARGRTLATRGDDAKRLQACQNCHGPAGIGREPVPYLAGLDAKYLQQEILAWRNGERDTDPSGSMALIARLLSESDIAAVASYYAAQNTAPLPNTRRPTERGNESP